LWAELDGQRQLAVLDLDNLGQSSSSLTPLGVDGGSPAWSPDGNWIAFTASAVNADGEPAVLVNIVHPDGNGLQTIFTWASTPSLTWAPDSQRLIITAWPTGADPANDRTTFYLADIAKNRLQHVILDDASQQSELISPAFRPAD
jgi:Tol biopolymer transport system component